MIVIIFIKFSYLMLVYVWNAIALKMNTVFSQGKEEKNWKF